MGLLGSALGCGASGEAGGPAYAIVHAGPEPDTLRLSVVSTLDASGTAELEASESVPLPAEHASMFTLDVSGVAYALDRAASAFQAYTIGPGPELRARRAVSLPVSLFDAGALSLISVSSTKVYVYVHSSVELLVWNPRQMTVTRRVPLGLGVADGYGSRAFVGSRLAGDELIVITHSWSDPARLAHDLTLSRVDVTTDAVISHEVDERRTGLRALSLPSGDLYLATRLEVAVEHWPFTESPVRPCALRLRAGAASLDPSWQASFSDWVGSPFWGGLVAGARGELLVLVAPEAEAAVDPIAALTQPIWQTWEVDLERDAARVHLPLSTTAYPRYQRFDDRLYLQVPDASGLGDTLVDVSDPSSLVPGIRLPPFTSSVLRVR